MTPRQYADLLEYIKVNNSWAKMFDCADRNRRIIKYIDAIFDSSSGEIWKIVMRYGGNEREFKIYSPKDVVKIYRFLDEICV